MLHVLDAAAVRRWCQDGRAALSQARSEIDALNVFPVPDGDTGTNLLITMESVLAAVAAAGDDLGAVAAALTRGALAGARGNSGVLLSQLLRGFAEVLEAGPADGPGVARALALGVNHAYAGVSAPVEGTMLTVARAAADAAGQAQAGLVEVVAAAGAAAAEALLLTRQQLAVLRDAGVVDAGGRGWVVLLEALAGVVREESGPAPGRATPVPYTDRPRHGLPQTGPSHSGTSYAGPSYEVQYLLADVTDAAVERLRVTLGGIGDSVVVAGAGGLFNVHVHVDDIGAALEAGIEAGRPSRISVTRFADAESPPAPRSVVAVGAGAGLARLLRDAGAVVVEEDRPSPERLLAALRGTGSCDVVLLPGSCQVGAELLSAAGVRVHVVATSSAVQALAALAVADQTRPVADDVAAMRSAAAATRTAEVRRAVQSATTSAGPIVPGDALGVVDGAVVVVGADVGWVACRVLERLCPGAELVTVVLGLAAPDGLGERLRDLARDCCPEAELEVIDGGQPDPPVLLGAE